MRALYYTYCINEFRYYSSVNEYWKKRNIPGPEPELLFGNIRSIWSYDKPRSIVFRDWTKKYGKVYGIYEGTRKMLVVSDFEMTNEILVKQFDHFYARARLGIQNSSKDGPQTHLVEAKGAHWKRLRALGSYGFTKKSLRQIQPTVEESAKLVINELEKHSGQEVNALEYYQEFTMDVISKVALGLNDVKMFNNELLEITKAVFARPYSSPVMVVPSLFPSSVDAFKATAQFLGRRRIVKVRFVELLMELEQRVHARKKQREAGSPSSGDFIDIFLDAEVDESEVQFGEESSTARKLALQEVVGNCLIFLLAGFDTTSNSLAYTTHFLANRPEVQEKLRDEIESVFPDEEIDIDRLNELKYTECVIKETLRHYPLGSVVVTRECTKPTVIKGHRFEVGDLVFTDTWSLHMDKEIWGEDAGEFRPERWLDEDSKVPRAAFQAFGEGPRQCIGMRLAYMEEKIALIHLLKNFTIEKTANTNSMKLVGSMTVSPDRVMVKMEKRR